ncbi:Response regulator [Sulfidibacter corallicola]|uniref:Response regulator n=1 Tax=Sulfidibacter corallicola TaxID=2818388 RepID=A0A8A4TJV9_SULCO|nr:response regulator [Sulfidibacter corallicola]QTD49098.1 response regulator [Sulfidibacter corallicola]
MSGKTVNILLIEDDDIDAEGVKRAFKKARIANPLLRAKDGVEALEMLRGENGKDVIPIPHLLLVDLNMPRMDGIEFMEELRGDPKFNKTIAFILTTSKRDEDKMAAYDLNVAGYLVKSKVGDGFVDMIDMLDHFWKIVEFPE